MIINMLMEENNITKYRLSKLTGIPYMTINDLCNEKTDFKRCPAENIYKIAKVLNVSVEYLMEYKEEKRISFDLFKSNVCHKIKEMGDISFMIELLESNEIRYYEEKKWYPECLYLLAMLDYLSRVNNFPLINEFDDLRRYKLQKVVYPSGIVVLDALSNDKDIKTDALKNAIPEFLRFNIVESDIRDVI